MTLKEKCLNLEISNDTLKQQYETLSKQYEVKSRLCLELSNQYVINFHILLLIY